MSDFVTVYTFSNSFQAEVIKGRLESEGIKAFLIDENTGYTIGPTILDGVRLQVKQEDYLQAKHIVEKTLQES